ncbi:unnamed protein product (macronuclear) [Paramecium tetraurelia]|uniref:Transmembrane protein n=1 Tax=Paramecium tetraurelia TaxID=5888 RepID=A0CCA2_PARTE|nr:uncharacterized protein GSPATT00037203001 [Paramecium tetraurelia]CAK68419.1 unnamed protein product [Paramecium tetraurelia]|eukprot:XP_001435816.1 hypothetical protein (macronuclear) [Paramecium tetraurelia strain d4-2]
MNHTIQSKFQLLLLIILNLWYRFCSYFIHFAIGVEYQQLLCILFDQTQLTGNIYVTIPCARSLSQIFVSVFFNLIYLFHIFCNNSINNYFQQMQYYYFSQYFRSHSEMHFNNLLIQMIQTYELGMGIIQSLLKGIKLIKIINIENSFISIIYSIKFIKVILTQLKFYLDFKFVLHYLVNVIRMQSFQDRLIVKYLQGFRLPIEECSLKLTFSLIFVFSDNNNQLIVAPSLFVIRNTYKIPKLF